MGVPPLETARLIEVGGPCDLDELVWCWTHDGEAAELVRRLKYGRATAAVSALAVPMAAVAPPADLVTWVPATPGRRRDRGFDQGELLARAIARRIGVRARRLLRRVDNQAQTGRDRDGRIDGPTLVSAGRSLRLGPSVLLVDDVSTTGATLATGASVLRDHGASQVFGLVATRARPHPTARG